MTAFALQSSVTDSILCEKLEGIACITLNRPEVLNALDEPMLTRLQKLLEPLATDRSVRVVIIRGAGDAFMAGGDIRLFEKCLKLAPGERYSHFAAAAARVGAITSLLRALPQPVIASVHGACAGYGLSLVLACDLAIAAEDTIFTMAYCQLGVTPDGGGSWFLPRVVGMKRAFEIAALSEKFDAVEAERKGLLNRVVPADGLREATMAMARRLAAGPAMALARTKALLNATFGATLEQHLMREGDAFAECTLSHDFREGVDAFLSKRRPYFSGE